MTALIYRVAWMRELRLIFGFSTAASAAVLDASRYARALEEMEPDVPWRRPILERRAQAYAATGNSRAPVAQRELVKFMEKEPPPFAPGAPSGKN
jgi:hypothetical protein